VESRKAERQPSPDEPVCLSAKGCLRDPSNTNRELQTVVFNPSGFGWMRPHNFRKSVATHLDERGLTAREIAGHLGHKNPSLTQDVYMDRRAMASTAGANL
jgi:integrase